MDEHRLRTGRNETLLTETLFCDTDLEKKGFVTLLNHWQHFPHSISFNTILSHSNRYFKIVDLNDNTKKR